jgi:Tfp pilus assembly protein PilF
VADNKRKVGKPISEKAKAKKQNKDWSGKYPGIFSNYSGKGKVIFFLFIIVFAIYGNTIPNDYSFDDDFVAYNNPQIQKGFKAIPEIFKTRYYTSGKQNYDYRPIVKASFAIEYGFFKSNPHISHFINVLLYFILCVMVFLLLNKLLKEYNPWIAIIAALIFTVHPVHTEVVASLKNRDELFSMIGAFAALFAFIKQLETKKFYWYPIAIFFLAFAYLSKSTVSVYIILIPLTLYFFYDIKVWKVLIILASVLFIFWLSKYISRVNLPMAEREILYFENPLYYEKGFWLRIGSAFIIILFYLRLLIFPHPLLFYYGYNQIQLDNLSNPWAIASLIICIIMMAIAIWYFKRKHVISYSILFFFISISLYTNIIKPPPGIVAERFLLTPSLGFSIILAVLIFIIFRIDLKQKAAGMAYLKKPFMLAGIIMVMFCIKTIARNSDWKNFETLYSHDIKYLNNSAKANSVYAALLSEKIYKAKNYKTADAIATESVNYYKKAVGIYPKYSTCWNNIGMIYYKFYKKPGDAILYWKEAAKCDPNYADPYFNIAVAYESAAVVDSAILYYEKTIKRNKNLTPAYSFLANLYYNKGEVQKAIIINDELIRNDTITDAPYINLGNYCLLNKDTVKAIIFWEKAIRKQPANPKLCINLANYFRYKGDVRKADYYSRLSQKPSK